MDKTFNNFIEIDIDLEEAIESSNDKFIDWYEDEEETLGSMFNL